MSQTKVVVFDLYNTLVEITDNRNFFLQIYKASTNSFNLSLSSYLKTIMTKNKSELFYLPKEFSHLYHKI